PDESGDTPSSITEPAPSTPTRSGYRPLRPRPQEAPMAELDRTIDGGARIKVVGVGGGGSNAVNRMIRSKLRGVEFIAVNTDLQALNNSDAQVKMLIGGKLAGGMAAGGVPGKAEGASEESRTDLEKLLADCDMVFVT